jgi:hypothetical protein
MSHCLWGVPGPLQLVSTELAGAGIAQLARALTGRAFPMLPLHLLSFNTEHASYHPSHQEELC